MAQPAADDALCVTVTSMGGEVLLGPRAGVRDGESVRELKRRLPDRGGAWRVLLESRELLDGEPLASICGTGGEIRLSAVIVGTAAAELERLTADARDRQARLQQESEQWLVACASADDDERLRRRDADVRAYRQALATLLQQIEDLAIAQSRRGAMDGQSSFTVHLNDLQFYGLGRKFYFTYGQPLRVDPVLRGWYFSGHADALDPRDVPEVMQLKRPQFSEAPGPDHGMQFVNAVARELVPRFEQQGLRVSPGFGWGELRLSWAGGEEDPDLAGYAKWWLAEAP